MINNVSKSINELKTEDIYSYILMGIYKATQDPNYSTLSELIYAVDRKSLLNLCAVFGGCTVKIPTIQELKIYTSGLLVYDLIHNQNYTFSSAYKETGLGPKEMKKVNEISDLFEELLNDQQ